MGHHSCFFPLTHKLKVGVGTTIERSAGTGPVKEGQEVVLMSFNPLRLKYPKGRLLKIQKKHH